MLKIVAPKWIIVAPKWIFMFFYVVSNLMFCGIFGFSLYEFMIFIKIIEEKKKDKIDIYSLFTGRRDKETIFEQYRRDKETIFEQYKMYAEMAEKTHQYYGTVNTFFATIHTGAVTLLGYWVAGFVKEPGSTTTQGTYIIIQVILVCLIAICTIWWRVLESYKQLHAGRGKIIRAVEEYCLPFHPFTYEWDVEFGRGDREKYLPVSHPFRWLPFVFIVLYSFLYFYIPYIASGDLKKEPQAVVSLKSLSSKEFGGLVEEEYRKKGYSVTRFGEIGADGGFDLRLIKDGEHVFILCKQWRAKQIEVNVVQELYGAMIEEKATAGIIISFGAPTRETRDFIKEKPIKIIQGDSFEKMIQEAKEGKIEQFIKELQAKTRIIINKIRGKGA